MFEVHIRHGQSQQFPPFGLTERGKSEVLAASAYLHQHFPEGFRLGFQSPSRRAKETAQLLGYSEIDWQTDARLRELEWGDSAPKDLAALVQSPEYQTLSWRHSPSGESWAEVLVRSSSLYKKVDQHYSTQNRLFVSHGGTLHVTRMFREHFSPERFPELFEAPYKYFTNCQLIIYSDRDPQNGTIDLENRWVKSVCPWDEGHAGHDWLLIPTP